jgi:hypothetical protein
MKTKTKKSVTPRKSARQEIEEEAINLGGAAGESNLAARVVLASFKVGPDVKRIAKFLGISAKSFQPMAERLRKNGCWQGGKVSITDIDNPQLLYIDAALMAAVALGYVERADA